MKGIILAGGTGSRLYPMTKQRLWTSLHTYEDIKYEFYNGIAKITINRPEVRNAFRPKTTAEMIDAFTRARDDERIGVIILTGEGDLAFCSGGDQKVRGNGGYVGDDNIPRLNVLDLQTLIRKIPKPVVAMVAGYAIGGGHVLHVVCDLTIAADNATIATTGFGILRINVCKSNTFKRGIWSSPTYPP